LKTGGVGSENGASDKGTEYGGLFIDKSTAQRLLGASLRNSPTNLNGDILVDSLVFLSHTDLHVNVVECSRAPPSQSLYLIAKSKPLTTRCSLVPVTKCRCPVERSSGLPSASLFCMSNVGKATALTIPHLWRKLRHASKDSANTSVHVLHRYPMIVTWTSNGFG
jgi:hypothetical protein